MIGAVRRAVANVRSLDAAPLSQGLSAANARRSLHEACDLVAAGLDAALRDWEDPPRSVGIVAAHGVFTSPLEWMALYAAAGAAVRVKASGRDPRFVTAAADAFRAEGLDVTASTDRHLPPIGLARMIFSKSCRLGTPQAVGCKTAIPRRLALQVSKAL